MDYDVERSFTTNSHADQDADDDLGMPGTQHDSTAGALLGGDGTDDMLFIDELQNQGIGMTDIQKLKAAGICTIKGVLMNTMRALCRVKGMSEAKVDKIKEAARKLCDAGFVTALEYSVRRQNVLRITTGSSELDKLIGGGVQSMSITEVFGEFRTGKTQLSHTLCVAVQLPVEKGGADGKAAYIDTEGTFRPDRLKEIAVRFGLDPEEVMENVIFARAFNSEHQMELITLLAAKFAEEPAKYRLLVVDSIISLFRTDFTGRGELGERQQKLNIMLARLLRISEEYNVAVFITNQVSINRLYLCNTLSTVSLVCNTGSTVILLFSFTLHSSPSYTPLHSVSTHLFFV